MSRWKMEPWPEQNSWPSGSGGGRDSWGTYSVLVRKPLVARNPLWPSKFDFHGEDEVSSLPHLIRERVL
jgi:hypothetical protein